MGPANCAGRFALGLETDELARLSQRPSSRETLSLQWQGTIHTLYG